jgi:hypothetical protein
LQRGDHDTDRLDADAVRVVRPRRGCCGRRNEVSVARRGRRPKRGQCLRDETIRIDGQIEVDVANRLMIPARSVVRVAV